MVDRKIGDHAFQIALRPGRERSEDDRANREAEQPRPDDFDSLGKSGSSSLTNPYTPIFESVPVSTIETPVGAVS